VCAWVYWVFPVAVFNQAREGGVDGTPQGAELRAIIQDLSQPSKLSVGPINLPIQFYGPYWVLAAGPGALPSSTPPPPHTRPQAHARPSETDGLD
jgi:hypothetical protein